MILKVQKFSWANIVMIEMFIFANFVQKLNFEESHFQNVGVRLPELLLFVLGSLRVLGESCFKATKASLDSYFYH